MSRLTSSMEHKRFIDSDFAEEVFAVFFVIAAMAWFMTGGGLIYVIMTFVEDYNLLHKIFSIVFAGIGWFIQIMLWLNSKRNG